MMWGYKVALTVFTLLTTCLVHGSVILNQRDAAAAAPTTAATPGHDEGELHLLPTDTALEFPVGTFVENIAVRPCGKLLLTILAGQLVQFDPNVPNSKPAVVHQFAANVTNVIEVEPDTFYVLSGVPLQAGTWSVFKVDLSTFVADDATGTVRSPATVTEFVKVPKGLLLNGAAFLPRGDGLMLVGDSSLGLIFSINMRTHALAVWSQDPLLTRLATREVNISTTAVNGIRVLDKDVYAANSWNAQFLRIGTTETGAPKGKFEILADNLVIDDFALDPVGAGDRVPGTAYLTTHIFNSVVSLTPQGVRSRIAGGPNDAIVAGTTSAAFGRTKADSRILYVTTDGGLFSPLNGKVGPGRVLKMNTDQPTY